MLKVVTMAELRLEVLLEAERTGLTVTEICRRYGISRQTYYRYRRRYLAEGLAGLEDRSRRPLEPANQIPIELEIRICEMRRDHPRWGARRIRAELTRAGVEAPAVSTIHQALRRNGLVATGPRRRPKADKRFEREVSNDLWQIDATQIPCDDGTKGGGSTCWTTTPGSCWPLWPVLLPPVSWPGTRSNWPPHGMGCPAKCYPTTG